MLRTKKKLRTDIHARRQTDRLNQHVTSQPQQSVLGYIIFLVLLYVDVSSNDRFFITTLQKLVHPMGNNINSHRQTSGGLCGCMNEIP